MTTVPCGSILLTEGMPLVTVKNQENASRPKWLTSVSKIISSAIRLTFFFFMKIHRKIWMWVHPIWWIDGRINWTKHGNNAWIRTHVPRSLFFVLIFPKLTDYRIWMAHWGDWSLQQFNFRILGQISRHTCLEQIFGKELLLPKERTDLYLYNEDPSVGEVGGFMCFLNKPFTFSVRWLFPNFCDFNFLYFLFLMIN